MGITPVFPFCTHIGPRSQNYIETELPCQLEKDNQIPSGVGLTDEVEIIKADFMQVPGDAGRYYPEPGLLDTLEAYGPEPLTYPEIMYFRCKGIILLLANDELIALDFGHMF